MLKEKQEKEVERERNMGKESRGTKAKGNTYFFGQAFFKPFRKAFTENASQKERLRG
ncbi:MAG: hypothetical protein U9O85_02990 [Euryarchaeota archaeon]|nr:hypothetical protein [Euryarchaeota archaeon]